jgi:hypothetical protein
MSLKLLRTDRFQENINKIQSHTTYAKAEKVFVIFILVGFPFLLHIPIIKLVGHYNVHQNRALAQFPVALSPIDIMIRSLSTSWGYLFLLILMIGLWFWVGQACGFEYARMHSRSVYLRLNRVFIGFLLYLSAIGFTLSLKELVIGSIRSIELSGGDLTISITTLAFTFIVVISALVGFWAKKKQDTQQELAYRPAEIYDWIAWMYKETGIGELFINAEGDDPHDIRCTLFMRYKSSHSRLVQVCDYYPSSSFPVYRFGIKEERKKDHGKANRTYRITNRKGEAIGVLGYFVEKYLHEKNHAPADWKKKIYTTYLTQAKAYDRASFIDITMKRFHYPAFFARQISDNRKSYYCIAITTQAQELLGVLYFDSCDERTFTTKNWEGIQKKIILYYLTYFGRILTQHE